MARPDSLARIPLWSCCALSFLIACPFLFSSIASILVIAAIAFTTNWRELFRNLGRRRILLVWMLYYLLHVLSYTYSADKQNSLFDLESKLTLFFFPLLIGAGISFSRRDLEYILLAFIAGMTCVFFFCMTQAIWLFSRYGNTFYFFYHDLVKGLDANAVYVAWYAFFCLATLFFFRWEYTPLAKSRLLCRLLILTQVVFLVLLSSRSLLLLFACFLIPYYIFELRKSNRLSRGRQNIVLTVLTACLLLLLLLPNPVTQRYKDILNDNTHKAWLPDYRNNDVHFNNLTTRLFFWRVGMENMSLHHLWLTGAGNGDVTGLQNQRMHELGLSNIYNKARPSPYRNANLHNMYLQTLLMIGIPGLIVFLIIMAAPFFQMRTHPEGLLWFAFHLCSSLFMMQEAALQTQAGIIFFAFFSMIFWNRKWSAGSQAPDKATKPELLLS